MRAALEGKIDAAIAALRPLTTDAAFNDGEGLFYAAEIYAKIGLLKEALALLHRAVDAGFLCLQAFEGDPYLEPVRRNGTVGGLLDRVTAERELIVSQFVQSGGRGLLGLQP